jgi:hypothetical protein
VKMLLGGSPIPPINLVPFIKEGISQQGDTATAKAAHQEFRTLSKDAYPTIPVLNSAKGEDAKRQ